MVTRVDKKPIIYNTCLIRFIKPAILSNDRKTLQDILAKARGHNIPKVDSGTLLEDYEDIDYAFKIFGIDEPAYQMFGSIPEEEEDDAMRIARVCLNRVKTVRQMLKHEGMCESMCKAQRAIISNCERIYFGTEAVYRVFSQAICGGVFANFNQPNYRAWCVDTAKRILLQQSAYMFIHPTAVNKMADLMGADMDYKVWYAWDMFKKIETLAIRIGSRKNLLAHAFYSGANKKEFTPSKAIEDDFELPMTGYAEVRSDVKVHMVLGLRIVNIAGVACVLSHDDCINLATMAQCYFRTAMYFTKSNGYPAGAVDKALSLVKDISCHAVRLIDAGKNFSHIIRSMHILSQGEFNDMFEAEVGLDLGWRERSENYRKEAAALDSMGAYFHKRAVDLAVDPIDRLNTCFIYHVFVGDEMGIQDLRDKVKNMTKKVRSADKDEWKSFIAFVKSYTLCRFMLVNKRKPRCGGDINQLNATWATRCVQGQFTMPPHSDWGAVWIQGEFSYTCFAETWHLEAQDVAYVVKDSAGLTSSKYVSDRRIHSELLMAMTHGNILDVITGSTPKSARSRICNQEEVKEVVLTTAPKAENAKPSWKKRVTFAADCEFRKMQAEYDRNCRRVMSFVRGPSLGVDQCILEKQFADIADATATGLSGAICSHDISAWSESMDRERKFEFEQVLINMFDKPAMCNIKDDWSKIKAVVTKQGVKDTYKVDNGSFQGFDGSASTILHSLILIYCIDTARRKDIIPSDVRTNMATLIDDCIALMVNLHSDAASKGFWTHLKETYLKLGFEIDDLKSIFSTIKGIYLSRRFLTGGEVPADFKVFIKAHSSYEDPLRCSLDVPGDIFGAMRGAADANGEAWYIYFCSTVSVLAELAHSHNCIMSIPPSAAAVFALCPVQDNGWGFPSIVSWATNDVTDKRAHFNAIMELSAVHALEPADFTRGVDVYPRPVAKAMYALKAQSWRIVSYSNIFTNPFEAIREGPLKPDMLRRNAIQEILADTAIAEPWSSLLKWNNSSTTQRVREMLIQSGPLHAPTLCALVNCMPDNYRLSLIGKAVGSESLLGLLSASNRIILKRRVSRCASTYFQYSRSIYQSCGNEISAADMASLTYIERTKTEREEFYTANGVVMTDHTFPDPVATFTMSSTVTGSVVSPNLTSIRIWDKMKSTAHRTSHFISDRGIYVPKRSGRVWEVTCEYAKGWDSVSQRVAMGLAILARAEADGHSVEGLLIYFIKSWNELSNITPKDTHLIAIHGSIKRLDANPGSSTHPIIVNRNILRGFNNRLKTALDAIPVECNKATGSSSHLHDFLSHDTAMRCVTALMFSTFQFLGVADITTQYNVATRQGVIVPECEMRMDTAKVANMIEIEIMDGADNYGLLQACPELRMEIAIPTMKASWVKMINALMDRNSQAVEELRQEIFSTTLEELAVLMQNEEVMYSPSVIIAADPAARNTIVTTERVRLALAPTLDHSRTTGDIYTVGVRTVGSKFSRALTEHQPAHVMAATAVRSLVWSRLKDMSAFQLAKLLYMDPDASTDLLKRCGSTDFWRGIISEICRLRGRATLSEMTMSAFRSLGVPGLHIVSSDDPKDVTQSVASYFGAHLRMVCVIISDLVTSLAGRKSSDFSKPFSERIVTNNPSVMNAKFRKDHMRKLIDTNLEMYKTRITDLEEKKPKHRGDKKVSESNHYGRLVELRCRLYVYLAADVDDSGKATVNMSKLSDSIRNAAGRSLERAEVDTADMPAMEASLAGIEKFMGDVKDLLIEAAAENDKAQAACDGWDPASGFLGIRLAHQMLLMDADMVMCTKFAVSASEVAPRVHKKVIVTPSETPSVIAAPPPDLFFDLDDDDDEGISLADMSSQDVKSMFSKSTSSIGIPGWQGIYALIITGHYSAESVNSKLGTTLPAAPTATHIREAHLEDFSDEEIIKAFPNYMSDYCMGGIVFNPEWLERDEADAYTTDEIKNIGAGFLM